MKIFLSVTALILVFELPLTAQVPPTVRTDSTSVQSPAEKVDQLFAQWNKPDTPGCALAVIKDGQIIYKRGYGMANLEVSVPMSSASVFNTGSLAKQFTAMSILMLAQQGKLTPDDDIRKYIPEMSDFGKPITIRHLIQHTSGLRDGFEMLQMSGWRSDDVHTKKDILDMAFRQRTLNFKPGDELSYSNTGYELLGLIVERVTGQPLPEFSETNIFKPLGMTNTHIYDDHRTIIKGLVDGYLPKEGGGFIKGMPTDDLSGSNNLYTTVEDLALWSQNFYDKRVGGEAVIGQMLTPGVLNNGEKITYAYGLYIESYKGLRTIRHDGARLGYRAEFVRFPEQNFSMACLCNVRAANPELFTRRVADIYLADQYKQAAAIRNSPTGTAPNIVSVSGEELSSITGLYWNPVTDLVRRIYVKEGKLMLFRAAGNESELAPLGGNSFQMLGVSNKVEIAFMSTRPGAPLQMLTTVDGGKPSAYELVKPMLYTPQQLTEFTGTYYSSELNATYRMTIEGGKLILHTGNWGDFSLPPRFADSFADMEQFGSIMFTRDQKNRVSGFIIRSGKIRNLRLDKVKPVR